MDEQQPTPRRSWRPRLSLLTVLLLMTIVGLAIVVALQWREVGPLRAENHRMRNELGLITISDPHKAYAVSLQAFEDDTWKWRIYLPPGAKYTLNAYSGHLPSPAGRHDADWFGELQKHGSGMASSMIDGEFTLAARVLEDGKNWFLVTRSSHHEGDSSVTGGKTSIWQPSGDWLSDRRARFTSSDVSNAQTEFKPDAPILLLICQRPIITDLPGGGYTSRQPTGAADGFALWLEPAPFTATAKSAKP